MAIASANREAVRFVEESTLGTTPAAPTLNEVSLTAESLNFAPEFISSSSIRSDRQVEDLIQVGADAAGSLDFELRYGVFDTFFEHALYSSFSADLGVSNTDISADDTDGSFNSASGEFGSVVVGQWIEVRGFTTNTANNGWFQVSSATTTKLIVEGGVAALTTESAGDTVTVGGGMIRNGVVEKSMSIQKEFADATVPEFVNFTGVRSNGFSLAFAVGAILTGSFDLQGLLADSTQTQFAGSSTNPSASNEILNAVGALNDITIDNLASTACFSSLDLTLSNNLRPIDCIGTLGHVDLKAGTVDVSGSTNILFEDATEYAKFLAGTAFKISFRLTDPAGNTYIFTLPRCKYSSGTLVGTGINTDVPFAAEFTAFRDPTTDATIQIDRFVA